MTRIGSPVIVAKPGFHYTANATTTTQKQSDYKVEQSFFTLIALFNSKLVVVVVIIGLMETRLKKCKGLRGSTSLLCAWLIYRT